MREVADWTMEESRKLMSASTLHETRLFDLSLLDTFPGCKIVETRMTELTSKSRKMKPKPNETPATTLEANLDATPHPTITSKERSRDLSGKFEALRHVSKHETLEA